MRIERLNDMEQYIFEHGASSLEDLCQYFDVSMSTVRRDIAVLSRRSGIEKVYGGVVADKRPPATLTRRLYEDGSKATIGRLAATLIQDGMSIFLDSGTTTLCLLPNLSGKKNITVISHSLKALCATAEYPSLRVIALGGAYDPMSASFVGGNISEALSKMSIDLVFLSSDGVTLERGLTSATYSAAAIKKSVIQRNKRLVLMAESAKFGHDALLTFCGYAELSAVVTDRPLPEKYRAGSPFCSIGFLSSQYPLSSPYAALAQSN